METSIKKARIVLTGGSGMLGKYLLAIQPSNFDAPEGIMDYKYDLIAPTRDELDVSNQDNVLSYLFKCQPDIIIHTACDGNVDSVENNSSEAVKSDLLGTIYIKDYCEKMNCKLITLSSNAVYDGQNPPYNETSARNPINFYGKIKSLADDIIMKSSCDWLIVRPILFYGWSSGRKNWVTKIIDNLSNNKELSLVTNSFTQPTYAADVANAIWHLIKLNNWKESYNVSTYTKVSIWAFGLEVCDVFGLDMKLIHKAKLSDFKTIAPRPLDTCYDTTKIEKTGFKCMSITEGLKAMIKEAL